MTAAAHTHAPDLPALSGRGVPERLSAVVARCLARNPFARFQTIAELLRALDEFTPLKVYPEELTPEAALLSAHGASAGTAAG